MIGQDRIVSNLNSYSLDTLPHSIMFVGDVGCGKHTLVKELANNLKVDVIDISESISLDVINEIASRPIKTFYIIDCSKITERHQNIILKFLEEPSSYAYIFLLCTGKATVLQTILNRCVVYEFAPYTRETLRQFLTDQSERVIDVCTTPGQVLSIHAKDLEELQNLCNTIITRIGKANYSNTLSIVKKMNLKDEFDKFDIAIFLNVLLFTIFNSVYTGQYEDKRLFELFRVVSDYRKRLKDSRLNKEYLLESLLTTIWEMMR